MLRQRELAERGLQEVASALATAAEQFDQDESDLNAAIFDQASAVHNDEPKDAVLQGLKQTNLEDRGLVLSSKDFPYVLTRQERRWNVELREEEEAREEVASVGAAPVAVARAAAAPAVAAPAAPVVAAPVAAAPAASVDS